MNWIKLENIDQIKEIEDLSEGQKVLLFKFSPGCAINYVVKNLLEREWAEGEMRMRTYLLDVADKKVLSAEISSRYSVEHESPQVIILEDSTPIFSASHGKILFSELRKFRN